MLIQISASALNICIQQSAISNQQSAISESPGVRHYLSKVRRDDTRIAGSSSGLEEITKKKATKTRKDASGPRGKWRRGD
jgi:hypothetical protein